MPWIGVDLDGTLAESGERGSSTIGPPISKMVTRVKAWLLIGKDVRILTARAYPPGAKSAKEVSRVEAWCEIYLGTKLPVTCMKDYEMETLYDDRAVQVVHNTGEIVE